MSMSKRAMSMSKRAPCWRPNTNQLVDENGRIQQGDFVFEFKRTGSKLEQVEQALDNEEGNWGWVDVTDEVQHEK
jgi:hypothetical protein